MAFFNQWRVKEPSPAQTYSEPPSIRPSDGAGGTTTLYLNNPFSVTNDSESTAELGISLLDGSEESASTAEIELLEGFCKEGLGELPKSEAPKPGSRAAWLDDVS
jgi:hypothetical protein